MAGLPVVVVVVAAAVQGKRGKASQSSHCLALPVLPGKARQAGKTGPGQTKPRLGTTVEGSPGQGFWGLLLGT